MAVEGNYFSVTRYVGGTLSCQLALPIPCYATVTGRVAAQATLPEESLGT